MQAHTNSKRRYLNAFTRQIKDIMWSKWLYAQSSGDTWRVRGERRTAVGVQLLVLILVIALLARSDDKRSYCGG